MKTFICLKLDKTLRAVKLKDAEHFKVLNANNVDEDDDINNNNDDDDEDDDDDDHDHDNGYSDDIFDCIKDKGDDDTEMIVVMV